MKRLFAFAGIGPAMFSFLLLWIQVAVAQRDAGEEASNTATAELVEDPDGDQQRGQRPSPARREALKRRAGEKIAGSAQGRAVVLGMHIQESDFERARVIDVGPATPAFDAGIRKGDEIVSFDGFRADTYRDWVDGMRRLSTDTPDGDTLPIVINRQGRQINLRLRVPESNAGFLPGEDRLTLNQTTIPGAAPQPGAVPVGQGGPAIGNTGDNVLLSDAFGNEFNDASSGATENAIAEIFRLSTAAPTPGAQIPGTPGVDQRVAAAQPQQQQQTTGGVDPGGRVGVAGFRNDANGLFVMLDVGGLPPGTYQVGIDDPGVLQGAGVANQAERDPNLAPQRTLGGGIGTERQVTPPRQIGPLNGASDHTTPADAGTRGAGASGSSSESGTTGEGAPAGTAPRGGSSPQGRLDVPTNRSVETPRSVLAQVVDTETAPGEVPSSTQLPGTSTSTTESQPGVIEPGTSATGIPETPSPTGDPRTADARRDPSLNGDNINAGATSANQIGTLTVDQNGAGRLQQVVEGLQVQDVIGQAIVIYGNQTTTTAPDPGAAVGPERTVEQGTVRNNQAATSQGGAGQAADPRLHGAGVAPNGASQMPIAGGLIRSMSGQTTGGTATDVGVSSAEQPDDAGATPSAQTPVGPAPSNPQ
jgi:hypothetical protein